MHKKYKKDTLVTMSVSLDDAKDKGDRNKALKFLKEQKADFPNYILDEAPEVWQEKLKFDGPPCVFVFNQQGTVEKQFKEEFTYADVERVVKKLVDKSK